MRRPKWGPRLAAPVLLAGFAAAAVATNGLATLAASPQSTSGALQAPQRLEAAVPSPAPYGAKVLGPAPASARVEAQLYFEPREPQALELLASAVSTPGNAAYHDFITVPEFAARFGASAQDVGEVDRYLRAEGLSVGPLARNGLSERVEGKAGRFRAAFETVLERVRTAGGGEVIGSLTVPSLPASIASDVAYVDGLTPWAQPTDDLVRLPREVQPQAGTTTTTTTPAGTTTTTSTSTPAPITTITATATTVPAEQCQDFQDSGLTPPELAQVYQLKGFYQRGDEGQGQTVGFIEYGLPDKSGIATYQACAGSSVKVNYVLATSPPSQVSSEVAADVEVIAALAPKANVVIYQSNQAGTGLAPWEMAISGGGGGGLPEVISSSWGSCEPLTGMGYSYYQAEETLFEEAAAQGQTVLVASGDYGSEGCYYQSNMSQLAVFDPSSAPDVTAVGGTASNTLTGPQYVWNSRGATPASCLGTGCPQDLASGGGASQIWPRPSYQPVGLAPSPACALGAQGCRELPDVSALGGDAFAQYCTACGGSGWFGIFGTSVAAPSWAAAVLLSESLCSTRIGFLNPLLYSEPSELTGQITSGNNDLLGVNNGLYMASPAGGYSMAGGLGYLGGADLSNGALCGAASGPAPQGAKGNAAHSPSGTSAVPGSKASTAPSPSPARIALACTKPVNRVLKGTPVAIAASDNTGCAGYWVVNSAGAVATFGAAINFGSPPKLKAAKVVGIVATPDYYGYWILASDGKVYPFGDATAFGGPDNLRPVSPFVGIARTPDGNGYWLASADGGVFAYGDAKFYGSMAGKHLNKPVIGIAAAPGGSGYWLLAADGGVFGFGDAPYRGSLAERSLRAAVVSMIPATGTAGYAMVAADGGVFAFGGGFYGSLGASPPPAPVEAMAGSVDGRGYYLLDSAGQVYAYGDARYLGGLRG
ncbi:MAG TPA: S53 family peptidase [Acidimicrobiales bacterium]|nr:S53 family peptidase [Acidimicrobiales bacterium]